MVELTENPMKGPTLQVSPIHCYKDSNIPQPVKLSATATLWNGLLDELCINSEGEVTAVINGVIPNAHKPIATESPCVVPYCDFSSLFSLTSKCDGIV